MPFEIKASTASASIHHIIMNIIDQLNDHEKRVFRESRTLDSYSEDLLDHPVIQAYIKSK